MSSRVMIALMMIELTVGPALALTPEEEQELAQRMSAVGKPGVVRLDNVEIEDYKRPPDANAADDAVHEFLVIRTPGEEPIKLAAYNFAMRTLQVGGGPGPNAIYLASSGIGRCCHTAHLVWIEGRAHHQEIPLGASDLRLEARGGPPRLRFDDDAFADWSAATPPVVLQYDPRVGEYRLDPDAMRKPPLSDSVVTDQAAEIRGLADDKADPSLRAAMIDLVYTGNAPSARALLDAAWPDAKPGKDEFLADFTRRLWSGEIWQRFELGRLLEAEPSFPRPAPP